MVSNQPPEFEVVHSYQHRPLIQKHRSLPSPAPPQNSLFSSRLEAGETGFVAPCQVSLSQGAGRESEQRVAVSVAPGGPYVCFRTVSRCLFGL